jgi:hypothetical protein
MFEHVVLRRAEGGFPISAGQIAEALLYYQKLQIVIDRGTLFKLIEQIGTGRLLTLLRRTEVSAVYCEEMLATHTELVGVTPRHNYIAFFLSGNKDVGEIKSPGDRLQFELERQGVLKSEARNFVKHFLDRVPIRKLSGEHFLSGGITAAAKRDLLDIEFTKKAFRHAIASTEGGYLVGDDLSLEIVDTEKGFFVFTNVDFDSINGQRAQAGPSFDPLTVAHLLNNLLEARADLALASFYGGDFITSAVTSSIIQAKHEEFLRRSNLNGDSRKQFSEVVLPDTPSLAEVIDSSERTFDEFLLLLDRAGRFKDWLKSVNPDENLVRTYMRDISSEDWIQRLPVKSVRYMLTLALDATNPAAGFAAGFMDNFVIEKLLSGWRPNHFVDGKLAKFIQTR